MKISWLRMLSFAVGVVLVWGTSIHAQGPIQIDMLGTTPIGSWQLREQTVTKEDGSKRVLSVKTSRISELTRGGEPFDWIELEMKLTRINKKGKVEEDPPIVAKVLIRRWFFQLDAGTALFDPIGIAQEIVVQTQGKPPVRFYGKGLAKAREMLGIETKFKWKQVATESVTIPAGTFNAVHLHGEGTADTRELLKKVSVGTSADFWYSTAVPFAHVKGEIVNPHGKTETWQSELKSYGTSGAQSLITEKPTDDLGKTRLQKIFGE